MTAVPPSGQKWQRDTTEEQLTTSATLSQLCWKRAKTLFQLRKEANTVYWDSLSKLWLTQHILRELNRRNRQPATNSVRTRITRRSNLKGELAWENSKSEIKRFSRHGGPDLQDLRGVSLTYVILRPLLIRSLQYPRFVTANSIVHVMSLNQSSSRMKGSTSTTSKTRKTSAYDPNFEQILIDNHNYPDNYDFPNSRDPP